MTWIVNGTEAPVTNTSTLITFAVDNQVHDISGITPQLRIIGTGLSYNETTGVLTGTITSIVMYDDANSAVMQTLTIPSATTSITDFLGEAWSVYNAPTTWGIATLDHIGSPTVAGDGSSVTVTLFDASNAVIGFIRYDGTNLVDPSLVNEDSTGVVTFISHLDASGNLVTGHVIDRNPDPLTVQEWSYGLEQLQEGFGNQELFYTHLTKGADTIVGSDGYSDLIEAGRGNDSVTGGAGNDNISGAAGNDTLNGGSGNDYIDGGTGFDSMVGGSGDDIYFVDQVGLTFSDRVVEVTGEGDDTVFATVSYTLAAEVERLTLLGSANINATGNGIDNIIRGNSGNNALLGGNGNDTVDYSLAGAVVVDLVKGTATGQGSDTLSSIEYITGSALADKITGNLFANVIDGGAGKDTMAGGSGNDTFIVRETTDVVTEVANQGTDLVKSYVNVSTLANFVENLTLMDGATDGTGNTLNNVITGNSAANTLNGGAGNDTLDGGTGNDTLKGGAGNDTYYTDGGDTITESSAADGTADTVISTVNFTLDANVENLVLVGSGDLTGTGNGGNNTITGNGGANSLDGAAGNDTLDGGIGIDTLIGGEGNDTYIYDAADTITETGASTGDRIKASITIDLATFTGIEQVELTGTGDIDATGTTAANVLIGNAGANVLKSGDDSVADTMVGGLGNDTYYVGTFSTSVKDVVTEAASGGVDTVIASVDYTLAANVENLTLFGSSSKKGTGNTGNNVITGNDENNTLDGGLGNDTLIGGEGTDILKGNTGTDTASYAGAVSGVTVSLLLTTAQNTGGAGFDTLSTIENLTGSDHVDHLTGNTAANVLDGGKGADSMTGGAGNDTYFVDDAGDVVTELVTGGTSDTINSTIAFDLTVAGVNVEHLTLLGSADVNGMGSAANNKLIGNSGKNILDGGAGNDTLDGGASNDWMVGGDGNDLYIVDDSNDVVDETGGSGIDTVQSSVTFDLGTNGADIENLTLTGTAAVNATGNAAANTIIGNTGANVLKGGAGDGLADTLKGGFGNDTYYVEAGDTVTEALNQGTDTIMSAATFSLLSDGLNVENLTLTGSDDVDATGNTLNNIVTGNTGNNALDGGTGNDKLYGGDGNDDLTGGSGNDTLYGENGVDSLDGGIGNDTLYGGDGADTLEGGTGNDTYYSDGLDTITETSTGGTLDQVFSSGTIVLGDYIEKLTLTDTTDIDGKGNASANTIIGNSGDNLLQGEAGNDTLSGGSGNDVLEGGTGNDNLSGSFGKDTFTFNTALGATNIDTITDFVGFDDTINLDDDIFTALSAGALASTAFVSGAGTVAATTAAQRIIYNTTTGDLYYDADGNGSGSAAVKFAVMGTTTHSALTAADFTIIA